MIQTWLTSLDSLLIHKNISCLPTKVEQVPIYIGFGLDNSQARTLSLAGSWEYATVRMSLTSREVSAYSARCSRWSERRIIISVNRMKNVKNLTESYEIHKLAAWKIIHYRSYTHRLQSGRRLPPRTKSPDCSVFQCLHPAWTVPGNPRIWRSVPCIVEMLPSHCAYYRIL
jgi:hypothetical protein